MTKAKKWFLALIWPKQVFFGVVALIIISAAIQAAVGALLA